MENAPNLPAGHVCAGEPHVGQYQNGVQCSGLIPDQRHAGSVGRLEIRVCDRRPAAHGSWYQWSRSKHSIRSHGYYRIASISGQPLDSEGASVPGEQSILLSALPPTREQTRLALIIALVLLVAFFVTLPFMQVQLPSLNAFIPVIDTTLFLNDLITAALLYVQFSVVRSRALLALAMGYLFAAAIIVPHALTFPDAFAPTGLLGAGLQTTVWLYIFWHLELAAGGDRIRAAQAREAANDRRAGLAEVSHCYERRCDDPSRLRPDLARHSRRRDGARDHDGPTAGERRVALFCGSAYFGIERGFDRAALVAPVVDARSVAIGGLVGLAH